MDINTTITDEQAAALAQQFRVTKYTDGNDLIAQCAASAQMDAIRRGLIFSVSVEKDESVLAATMSAFNSVSSTPVKLPPSKLPGGGMVVP